MASFLSVVRVFLLCLVVSAAGAKTSCKKPKVRREWRKFSDSQKADWIGAVNCLGSLPHTPDLKPSIAPNVSIIPPVNDASSFYDDLVYTHMDLNPVIHFSGIFLPWHRWYVQYFENQLVKRCGYKGVSPYWDWTLDSSDMFNSEFFDTSPNGVGGWGDPANDYQIYNGGFKDLKLAYPNPHHIRRNFSFMPFTNPDIRNPITDPAAPRASPTFMINTTMTKQNVDFVVNNFKGNFIGFNTYTESINGTHTGAHLILGGDMTGYCSNGAVPPACNMGPKWTPNDPLFFMHHAMVDKTWYDWQRKSPENKLAYGGGTVPALSNFTTFIQFPTGLPPFAHFDTELPGDGLWSNVTVWDVMDTKGDTLCYTYE